MALEWGPALRKLRCPVCQHGFNPESVSLIREIERELYLRCVCPNCQSVSAAVFIQPANLITKDDVLAAHDFLREYAGDAYELFKSG